MNHAFAGEFGKHGPLLGQGVANGIAQRRRHLVRFSHGNPQGAPVALLNVVYHQLEVDEVWCLADAAQHSSDILYVQGDRTDARAVVTTPQDTKAPSSSAGGIDPCAAVPDRVANHRHEAPAEVADIDF